MTEEQIELKAREKYCDGCNRKIEQCVWAWRNVNGKTEPNEENCGCSEVPAYIAGATENGIQWHDLRKKPNDLPKKGGEYWCYMLCDGGNYIYRAVVFQGNVFNHFYNAKIIGWCETPKFEE